MVKKLVQLQKRIDNWLKLRKKKWLPLSQSQVFVAKNAAIGVCISIFYHSLLAVCTFFSDESPLNVLRYKEFIVHSPDNR